MRYYEFVAERDMSAMTDKLRAMIDHPDTPENEREAAKLALDRNQAKQGTAGTAGTAHKVGADDLPNFGDPSSGKNTGTHKMGTDDLADFGVYTAKGTRSKKSNRGQQHDFTV